MESLSGLKGRVAFSSKLPLLMQSTSDSPKPVSVFELSEVNKIPSHSLEYCDLLLDFLVTRLNKNSPHIILKVLKIMEFVSVNGHSEFRSRLSRRFDNIRRVKSYNGPPDPLHGNALNIKVRQQAANLEELLFNKGSATSAAIIQSVTLRSGMIKADGFGNTPINPPPSKSETILGKLGDIAKTLATNTQNWMNPPTNESLVQTPPHSYQHYTPVQIPDDLTSDRRHDSRDLYMSESLGSNSAGPGGGWNDDSDIERLSSQSSISWHSSEHQIPSNGTTVEISNDRDWAVEYKLVEDITSEAGLRNISSKTLHEFTRRCSSLDVEKILEFLNERLRSSSSVVQLKSLKVLDHLLQSSLPDIPVLMYRLCPDIQQLSEGNNKELKSRAEKISFVLLQLNTNEALDNVKEETKLDMNKTQPTSQEDSLLGDLIEPQPATVQVPDENDFCSIFSGMKVQSKTLSAPQPAASFTALQESPQTNTQTNSIAPITSTETPACPGLQDLQSICLDPLSDVPRNDHIHEEKSSVSLDKEVAMVDLINDELNFDPLLQTSSVNGQHKDISFKPAHTAMPIAPANNSPVLQQHGNKALSGDLLDIQPVTSTTSTFPQPTSTPYPMNMTNLPLSGTSTIPLRLGDRTNDQDAGFAFIGKSSKKDAFSFVDDEIASRKNKR